VTSAERCKNARRENGFAKLRYSEFLMLVAPVRRIEFAPPCEIAPPRSRAWQLSAVSLQLSVLGHRTHTATSYSRNHTVIRIEILQKPSLRASLPTRHTSNAGWPLVNRNIECAASGCAS